jgi:hypothetical protein
MQLKDWRRHHLKSSAHHLERGGVQHEKGDAESGSKLCPLDRLLEKMRVLALKRGAHDGPLLHRVGFVDTHERGVRTQKENRDWWMKQAIQ